MPDAHRSRGRARSRISSRAVARGRAYRRARSRISSRAVAHMIAAHTIASDHLTHIGTSIGAVVWTCVVLIVRDRAPRRTYHRASGIVARSRISSRAVAHTIAYIIVRAYDWLGVASHIPWRGGAVVCACVLVSPGGVCSGVYMHPGSRAAVL